MTLLEIGLFGFGNRMRFHTNAIIIGCNYVIIFYIKTEICIPSHLIIFQLSLAVDFLNLYKYFT